jgi:hypothetical protein
MYYIACTHSLVAAVAWSAVAFALSDLGFAPSDDERQMVAARQSGFPDQFVLGSPINSSSNERGPFLVHNSNLLYFTSDRAGGLGSDDFYVVRRERP